MLLSFCSDKCIPLIVLCSIVSDLLCFFLCDLVLSGTASLSANTGFGVITAECLPRIMNLFQRKENFSGKRKVHTCHDIAIAFCLLGSPACSGNGKSTVWLG